MSKAREVIQYDKNGNMLKIYKSIKEAQNDYGITHISSVCRGKRMHDGGYMWRYAAENSKKQINPCSVRK